MAMYCIGDVQGCDGALQRLLDKVAFSPSRDTLYLLGDLVNRGPASAAVLRRCMALGDAAHPVLGNHDLHLLAVAHGVRKPGRLDTLAGILEATDRPALLDWLRRQPLARTMAWGDDSLLMVHAGVLPQWTASEALALAAEVEAELRGDGIGAFLRYMYGNQPDRWSDGLRGHDRLRVVVNALTRLRFCTPGGAMDFSSTDASDQPPAGCLPWFDVPGRRTAGVTVAFGHWSTLGHVDRPNLIATDTGCVWGGCLSAVRLGASTADREWFQVRCERAQAPGGPAG
ncbi:symmetrical bis(5'-nucleosyl)-tetraphosphatase [Ramlibacter sp. H39-3-26]|uniref:symmetrical bis(5'-nucleosyl)-tetraphosphatase n=1 Tax=Curvibacter soli TaxID=3031331 RepID=UPI0023DAD760|nr:symmetrical bis(5'-nucleosyl)-tetraphosphatase [Ramlibacter sp. H39-3-26]MDF1485433.1 symmetrical bis(5'-nucleosyl)-tetraphosphatase [Ramlibacter sp. H39-3-26]